MSYENFAAFYDRLQSDVDYKKRAEYIINVFEKYDRRPTLMLDMACGTGGFSLEFLRQGIDVIGVDVSAEMLSVARQKLYENSFEALLLLQSAKELDLYGTVDGAVCMLDSLNHITDEKELEESIKRISLFLEPGRLFVFDVNTEYKHKNILSNATFTAEAENVFCVWRNSPCSEDLTIDISLDFFAKTADGSYIRSSEDFCERAYSEAFFERCFGLAGLEKVAVLGDMSFAPPKSCEERVIFVVRKV